MDWGAVKNSDSPFEVLFEKDPHGLDPHAAVHWMTSLPLPFKSLTWKVTCPPRLIVEGGETKASDRGGTTTGSVTLLVAAGLLATAAVMVTVFPIGMVDGAVNIEATPSGVCAGTRVPQAPPVTLPVTGLPPQVTVQFTPALEVSPTGIILTATIEPAAREESCPDDVPLGLVTEICPAFTLEPLEQPERPSMKANVKTNNHEVGAKNPFGLPLPIPAPRDISESRSLVHAQTK